MELTDFYRCYNFLLVNWDAFSKQIRQEAEKVRYELHDELASWQPGKPKPHWNTYSERINAALRNEGLPELFMASPEKNEQGAIWH